MTALLDKAIEAHGGWSRWSKINYISATAKLGGALWAMKGRDGLLTDVRIEIDTRRQRVQYSPFGAMGKHTVYEPNFVAVVDDDGKVLESREDPRAAFGGHVRSTPWDNLHLVYFTGYAMWTYLHTPFMFRMPGFRTEEIEPWNEGGQTWRRLKVQFPADVPSHSTEQVFYFDEQGILVRHDYSADVVEGLPSANYATEPRTFDGIVVPTKRRVFARQPDNTPVPGRIAVAIDLLDIQFT